VFTRFELNFFLEKYAKAGFVRSTSALQLHFSPAAMGLCG
jgi:hypothetical protein